MRRRPAVKDPRRSSTNAATVVAVEGVGVGVEVAGVVVELVAAVAAVVEEVAVVPTAASFGLGRR